MSNFVNEKISQTGVGTSDWVILGDSLGLQSFIFSLHINPGADATISIEGTINVDIENPTDTVPSDEIEAITGLTALTAAGKDLYSVDQPLKAIRVNQTVGANESVVTVLKVNN